MPSPARVAVLGAPGCGAQALAEALRGAEPGACIVTFPAIEAASRAATPLPPALRLLARAGCASALLMGLDAPCPADAWLRALLARAGLPYQVLYGSASQRLRQARACLPAARGERIATESIAASALQTIAGAGFYSKNGAIPRWQCEKCSDPECEHRLFLRLLS